MSQPVQYVNSMNDFQSYLNGNSLFVAYFTASWCGPCKAIAPKIEELYQNYPNIEVAKIDIDENRDVAAVYQISSVPTFHFYQKKTKKFQVVGANYSQIKSYFESLSQLDSTATRNGSKSGGSGKSSEKSAIVKEVKSFLPSTSYKVLNPFIDYSGFESFNVKPFDAKNKDSTISLKLSEDIKDSTVITDADSQCVYHIPFLNIVKLYSILIKLKPVESLKFTEGSELSEDESDEIQLPNSIKVWKNLPNPISFDDANEGIPSEHSEEIDIAKASNGWYEIKLKFVKFQKVQSVDIFIDGDDEDNHVIIEKIVLVGVDGESSSITPLKFATEEEEA